MGGVSQPPQMVFPGAVVRSAKKPRLLFKYSVALACPSWFQTNPPDLGYSRGEEQVGAECLPLHIGQIQYFCNRAGADSANPPFCVAPAQHFGGVEKSHALRQPFE